MKTAESAIKTLFTLFVAVALVVIAAIVSAYSGVYDVSASSPHNGLVTWLLSTTSHASIERRSRDIEVPNLNSTSLARAGINDFDAMCKGCHGAPGQDPEAMGQGLNPAAPDLSESAAEMQPAELFWVTKHGIRMTGMPAWGATHDDDALWPVVAFMITLPELDADGYQALLASAEGMGHHEGGDGDGSHDHGDTEPTGSPYSHDHDEAPPGEAVRPDTTDNGAHDHSTHSHDEPTITKEEEPDDDGHHHEH